MKRRIRLTESDLHRIVRESVNRILNEDMEFDYVSDFHNGLAVVELNGKFNVMDQDGRIISDRWFDYPREAWELVR